MCTLHRSFSMPTNAEWVIVFIIRCSQIHIIFFSYVSTFRVKSDGLIFLSKFFSPEFIVHMNSCVCVCLFYISVALFPLNPIFFSRSCQFRVCYAMVKIFAIKNAIFSLFCHQFIWHGFLPLANACIWYNGQTVILFFGSKPTFLFGFDVWLVFDRCFEK